MSLNWDLSFLQRMLFEFNLKTIVLKFFSPAAIIMCVWREGEREKERETDRWTDGQTFQLQDLGIKVSHLMTFIPENKYKY